MLRKRSLALIVLSLCLAAPLRTFAVLTIEITGGVEAGMPIAVVPFEWRGHGAPPVDLRNVISADLYRSGRFDILPVEDFLSRPSNNREVRYKDWRLIKAEALVVGQMKALGENRFEVRFQLFDVFREKQLAGYRWEVEGNRLRNIAHQVSDHIVKTLIGKGPAFDSRIAFGFNFFLFLFFGLPFYFGFLPFFQLGLALYFKVLRLLFLCLTCRLFFPLP